ncbi:MAG: GntR family transcriptional regulator [Planctomycetota bacterium]
MNPLLIQLSNASGVPFYRQIVDQVAQLIRSGQLAPGTRLPSVRDLAGQLLVSLITVRRSYADLETAGLIQRRQGYGTYVSDDIKVASKKQAFSEARATLSDAITHVTQLGVTPEELRKIVDDLLSRKGGPDDKR